MSIHALAEDPWRQRARQNLKAAQYCIARHPALPFPAVSRIYCAAFQATVAMLQASGVDCAEHDGEVWAAAERERPGLGSALWRLYRWQRRADYATGPLDLECARLLVAEHVETCRSLGVEEV